MAQGNEPGEQRNIREDHRYVFASLVENYRKVWQGIPGIA
jgi:hypothetical protein